MTLPPAMNRLPAVGILAAMAVFFLLANSGAYNGYFHGDDLSNLEWTSADEFDDFAVGFVSPKYLDSNFRPVAHLFFFIMGRCAALQFPPYVAVLQCLHVLNVCLVWWLLGRLGFDIPEVRDRMTA